jgi:hypothetical protein
MVLVLDESGAKGYSKNKEKYKGEVGVMAGYLYTKEETIEIEQMFSQFTTPINNATSSKLHITDINEGDQKKLRDSIFFAIRKTKMQWFYQAVYSEGFHQSEFMEGRGGQEDGNKSLHVELFEKMLVMSLCMAHSIDNKNLKLVVMTDNVDEGTLKKFKRTAEFVRNIFLQNEREIFRTVKDGDRYRKEKAYISIKSQDMLKFESISIEIECNQSPLTIAADILANSVNYYLRQRQENSLGLSLNNKKAIEEHPLADLAFIPKDENQIIPLLDIVNRRQET